MARKSKVKTVKKGPIRKVKVAFAAGAVAAALTPIVKPLVEGWFGVELDPSFIKQGVVMFIDLSAYIAAIVGAYVARPAEGEFAIGDSRLDV